MRLDEYPSRGYSGTTCPGTICQYSHVNEDQNDNGHVDQDDSKRPHVGCTRAVSRGDVVSTFWKRDV